MVSQIGGDSMLTSVLSAVFDCCGCVHEIVCVGGVGCVCVFEAGVFVGRQCEFRRIARFCCCCCLVTDVFELFYCVNHRVLKTI